MALDIISIGALLRLTDGAATKAIQAADEAKAAAREALTHGYGLAYDSATETIIITAPQEEE